jgi:hypothetical protein
MRKPKCRKNTVIVLEQKMLKSKVWLKLTGASTQIFLIFRTKCKMEKIKGKLGRYGGRTIANNSEIVFTYDEAAKKYDISKDRFTRAIDQLVKYGFIDICYTTNGLHKVSTQYAISERWRDWGTNSFVVRKREIRKNGPGFKKGNELWKQKKQTQQVKTRVTPCVKTRVTTARELKVMRTNAHGVKQTTSFKFKDNQWLEQKVG